VQTIIQNVLDALSLGSLFALTALGIGLIFGVMRLMNYAHGDLITLGAYSLIVPSSAATATMFVGSWPAPAIVFAVALIVVICALICERLAFRPMRNANPSTLLISSFALSFFIQNGIIIVFTGRPKGVDLWPGLSQAIDFHGVRLQLLQLVIVGMTASLLATLTVVLKHTAVGRQMRAASEDFMMARFLGVRADRVMAIAFAVSGLLAAAVAIPYVSQRGSLTFNMGLPLVLSGFVATVIGGMGSLAGAVIGGFVVGASSVFFQVVLPPGLRLDRDAFVFALVLVILFLRPNGLVKVKSIEERV
jgi:branched-chain amino acid transport system permease protein